MYLYLYTNCGVLFVCLFVTSQRGVNAAIIFVANHMATWLRNQLPVKNATRKVEMHCNAIPPSIFNGLFIVHEGTEYYDGEHGTIKFEHLQHKTHSRINNRSFLHAGYMCDVLNKGYSFEHYANGECIDYHQWNISYQTMTGNLTVTAYKKWKPIGMKQFQSTVNIDAKDAKFSQRKILPSENARFKDMEYAQSILDQSEAGNMLESAFSLMKQTVMNQMANEKNNFK